MLVIVCWVERKSACPAEKNRKKAQNKKRKKHCKTKQKRHAAQRQSFSLRPAATPANVVSKQRTNGMVDIEQTDIVAGNPLENSECVRCCLSAADRIESKVRPEIVACEEAHVWSNSEEVIDLVQDPSLLCGVRAEKSSGNGYQKVEGADCSECVIGELNPCPCRRTRPLP